MRRALRERPRMVAAQALVLVVAFLIGFVVKGATGGDSGPSDSDKAKVTAAETRAREASTKLRATTQELRETNVRLAAATRRERVSRRTQARLRARARNLRRALTRARARR